MLFLQATAPPIVSDKTSAPVYEVNVAVSLRGRIEIGERKVSELLMHALETAGTGVGLEFAARDYERARREVGRNDRSGDFSPAPGGQRGGFVRASRRVDLAYILERNIASKKASATLPRVLTDRVNGWENLTAGTSVTTEKVFLDLRATVYDTTTNLSTGAIPRIKAEATRTLYSRQDAELYHNDRIRIWIFDFPVKITDAKIDTRTANAPRGLELTDEVIERVSDAFAKRLATMAPGKAGDARALPELAVESTDPNGRTLTLVGKLDGLKVGDLLTVPTMPQEREARTGEATSVLAKITRVGREAAIATIVNADGERERLPSGFVVDPRRPIRRL